MAHHILCENIKIEADASMNSQYRQTVEVGTPKKIKTYQVLSLFLNLLGLGLIAAAITASYYIFIGVGVLIGIGLWLSQLYYSSTKQFEYDVNDKRLVICKTNIAGRKNRVADILFADVTQYGHFSDIAIDGDLIATSDIQKAEIRCLVFNIDGKQHRLLFEPDGYLDALLNYTLNAK